MGGGGGDPKRQLLIIIKVVLGASMTSVSLLLFLLESPLLDLFKTMQSSANRRMSSQHETAAI